MSGLALVGKTPSTANPQDVVNRGALNAALGAGVSQAWVQSEVAALSASYATKVYTANAFSNFASPSYAAAQEALLIPTSSLGAPSSTSPTVVQGVATLDSSVHVPVVQMPNMGIGYVLGPFGPTATVGGGSTTATPTKIADMNIGVQGLNFRPWCFAHVFAAASNLGRPCVEMRISNGAPVSYAASTLVARGIARSLYNDYSAIAVVPVPDATGESPGALYGPTYAVWISLWLYDLNNQTTTFTTASVANAATFLIRTTL